MSAHNPKTLDHLNAIYAPAQRRFACRADSLRQLEDWQAEARPELCRLIGLDRIAEQTAGFEPSVELGDIEDRGNLTRQTCSIHTEPTVEIPFYLLRPKDADGPLPLGIFPHGHGEWGPYAGIYKDEAGRERIENEDRDVAVQAVRRGMIAIAPATRGLGAGIVPDVFDRHGKRDCWSTALHALLAGRTGVGERVWDMMRLLDWATALPDVDAGRIVCMGNSGGGVATFHTAACDTRITVAVPCGSFCAYVSDKGHVHHCDCNLIPGILAFGGAEDVAALIAPRHLLVVHGDADALFVNSDIDRPVAAIRRLYATVGAADHFDHRLGSGEHRFYKSLSWPFMEAALDLT